MGQVPEDYSKLKLKCS